MTVRRLLVGLAAGIACLVVLAAVTLGVLIWRFDPNAYKGRIEASIENATGLSTKLNGPIGLAWALHPTITIADVVVKNPPGFTTPDLARVKSISVQMDLPALIDRRVVVRSLLIRHPQVMLERSASGAANWLAPRSGAASVPKPPPSAASTAARKPIPFAVREIRIQDLDLKYRDDATGAAYSAVVPLVSLTAPTPQAPVKLVARGEANGRRFDLDARTASLQQFLGGSSPMPVNAKLHLAGTGEDLILDVAAPAEDQPIRLALSGQYRAQPVALTVVLGRAGTPLRADKPLPVRFDGEAAGSSVVLDGVVGDPAGLSGVDLALTAVSPDLARLSTLLDTGLPDLRALKLSGRIRDVGGLRRGFAVSDLKLVSQQGDLAGTLKVLMAPQPSVAADLHGARLDLAALRMGSTAQPAAANKPAAPSASVPARAGHMIPDDPLPVQALRQQSAEIALRLGTLQAGDSALQDVRAEAHLHGGLLAAKLHAVFDGGAADVDATADFRPATPSLALAVNAPGLPAGPLLSILGAPGIISSGKVAVSADLRGTGGTPHLIAATLSGTARLMMQNGTISTKALERSIGPAIARANPLAVLSGAGTTRLRCFAVRAQAVKGQVTLDPLLLSSDLLTISGNGRIDLAAETLALHLRPEGRAGSVAFSVPLTINGPLHDPKAEVTKGAPVSAMLGLLKGVDLGMKGPTCAGALAQVSGAAPPRPSLPKVPALPNPAGLLRQFLK